MANREWTLRRNCSITPRQLILVYAALCSVSLVVALIFTMRGAWYILGFAILELTAVGLAFLQYGRHATDREYIALIGNKLLIELVLADCSRQYMLDSRHARVATPESSNDLIAVEAHGIRVEVGRHLAAWKRREFALELGRALRETRPV
ncbi:DUF2244 domain-containing protein [Noviherbaspirillum pedocola]|uniref:DUF2244 domain-containing protein n=1 Tax=Noviherbaspirillum pedocola TaxID=2801341 RepID=A0A934SSJ1_9BURK|nr:DUF2244 domain-containing protein [Noviherbaspirillum pedocola]MBK4734734.1 DUF2244 domain-containing protein [Noviherbaspirillum pedocola]